MSVLYVVNNEENNEKRKQSKIHSGVLIDQKAVSKNLRRICPVFQPYNLSYNLTLFSVRMPTTVGPRNPGTVAKVFVIPCKIPAYEGETSRWLIKNPAEFKPSNPIEVVTRATAATTCAHPK